MANNYLESTKVRVFPSAYRGQVNNVLYDPESRIPDEFNLSNILNRAVNKGVTNLADTNDWGQGSFVISYVSNLLVCCIHGYFFRLEISATTKYESMNNLYAYVKLSAKNTTYNSSTNTDYPALCLDSYEGDQVLDDGTYFTGLKIESSKRTTETNEYCLHLLTWNSTQAKYLIPAASILKFRTNEIADIDNGTLQDEGIDQQFTTEDLQISNSATFRTETNYDYANRQIRFPYIYNNSMYSLDSPDDNYSIQVRNAGFTVENKKPGASGAAHLVEVTTSKVDLNKQTNVTPDTDSTSDTTGALQVTGGTLIKKKLRVLDTALIKNGIDIGTSSAGDKTATIYGNIKVKDGSNENFTVDKSGNTVNKGTLQVGVSGTNKDTTHFGKIYLKNKESNSDVTKITLDNTNGKITLPSNSTAAGTASSADLEGTAKRAVNDDKGNGIRASYGASLKLKDGTTDTIQLLNKSDTPSALNSVKVNNVGFALKLGTTAAPLDRGNGKNLIYVDAGKIATSSETVGSATQPVYLNNGTLTTCTAYGSATVSTANNVGTLTNNDTAVNNHIKFTIGNKSFEKTVGNVNYAIASGSASSAENATNAQNTSFTNNNWTTLDVTSSGSAQAPSETSANFFFFVLEIPVSGGGASSCINFGILARPFQTQSNYNNKVSVSTGSNVYELWWTWRNNPPISIYKNDARLGISGCKLYYKVIA